MAATSFTLFMYLPFELRARIWKLTAEPRTVKVVYPWNIVQYPIPPIVQTCREARQLGVYRKVYPKDHPRPAFNQRYSWVNCELDMADLSKGYSDMTLLQPFAPMITRLKIVEPLYSVPCQLLALGRCVNLKELHIVLEGCRPALDWHRIFTVFPLACGMENIFMVDPVFGTAALRPEYRSTEEDMETDIRVFESEFLFIRWGIQWGTKWGSHLISWAL